MLRVIIIKVIKFKCVFEIMVVIFKERNDVGI